MPDRDPPFVSDAPGGEEIPVVAWPLLFRARISHRVRQSDHYPWWVLVTVLAGLFASGFTITIMAVSLKDIAADLGTSETALDLGGHRPVPRARAHDAAVRQARRRLGSPPGVPARASPASPSAPRSPRSRGAAPALIAIRVLGSIPGAATGPTSMALIMRAFPEDDRVKAMGWWALVGAGRSGHRPGRRWSARRRDRLAVDLRRPGPAVADRAARRGRRPARDAAPGAGPDRRRRRRHARRRDRRRAARPHPRARSSAGGARPSSACWCSRRSRSGRSSGASAGPSTRCCPSTFFRRAGLHRLARRRRARSNFAYMGGFIITPLLMENRFGFSVAATSLAMVCRPLSNSIASPAGGYLAARIGERPAAVAGTLLVAVSMVLFAFAGERRRRRARVRRAGAVGHRPRRLGAVAHHRRGEHRRRRRTSASPNAAQQMVAMIGAVAGHPGALDDPGRLRRRRPVHRRLPRRRRRWPSSAWSVRGFVRSTPAHRARCARSTRRDAGSSRAAPTATRSQYQASSERDDRADEQDRGDARGLDDEAADRARRPAPCRRTP